MFVIIMGGNIASIAVGLSVGRLSRSFDFTASTSLSTDCNDNNIIHHQFASICNFDCINATPSSSMRTVFFINIIIQLKLHINNQLIATPVHSASHHLTHIHKQPPQSTKPQTRLPSMHHVNDHTHGFMAPMEWTRGDRPSRTGCVRPPWGGRARHAPLRGARDK